MAIRDILILPDKRLRLVSKPVEKVDTATKKLVEDMFETMYDAPGIGLAAIQIGEATRVVTIDVSKEDEEEKRQVFINPEIVAKTEDTNVHEEGCLSIPEYYEEVTRPAGVTVRKKKPPSASVSKRPRRFMSGWLSSWFSYIPLGSACHTSTKAPTKNKPPVLLPRKATWQNIVNVTRRNK